ncbi:cytochrome P450 family protein [Streptomyces sp. NPDC001889]
MTSSGTSAPVPLGSDGGPDLYEQVDRLRAAGPAVRVGLPEGVTAWSVSRGDVVRRLLTHRGVSRDARAAVPGYRPGRVSWLFPWVDTESMFTSEGGDHTRLRRLIGPAFSPRRIEAMRPGVTAVVDGLLDALEERPGDEPVDLRALFSYPVPTRVICDLFGVPEDQRPEVLRVFERVAATGVSEEDAAAVRDGLMATMKALVAFRRREPGEDMTSLLLAAREGGADRLSEQELVSTLILMLGAGSQTTIALIGQAVRALLTDRRQLDAVRADPGRWGDAIEETLRLHAAVMHLPLRWVTEDIDLGEGVVLRPGDAVLVAFGAHGRDPGVHRDADAFDLDRADKEHLAFGHGVHYCLGAPLARLEAGVALPALFARFPGIALAGDPRSLGFQRSFIANDVAALPVLLNHRGTGRG